MYICKFSNELKVVKLWQLTEVRPRIAWCLTMDTLLDFFNDLSLLDFLLSRADVEFSCSEVEILLGDSERSGFRAAKWLGELSHTPIVDIEESSFIWLFELDVICSTSLWGNKLCFSSNDDLSLAYDCSPTLADSVPKSIISKAFTGSSHGPASPLKCSLLCVSFEPVVSWTLTSWNYNRYH